jgi:Mrp family chromosome partitioning ATPase
MSTALHRPIEIVSDRSGFGRDRADIDAIWSDPGLIAKFLGILARLDLSDTAARPLTIGITASLYDEGATSVALGLAIALARAQSARVAIVDCDLGWPSVHRRLDIPLIPGLAELITGRADEDEALRPTRQVNLVALPAGKRTQRSSAIAERMHGWLARFKQTCGQDVLILDLPPVNVDDSVGVLASVADAIVLVVQSGVTPRTELQRALSRLQGHHLAGIVLNRTLPSLPDWLVHLFDNPITTG